MLSTAWVVSLQDHQCNLLDGCAVKAQAAHPSLKLEIVVTTDDESGSKHRTGLITDAIEHDIPHLDGWRAYVCGAPPMVEATAALIKQRGIQEQHVYADAFYASGT